MSFTAIKRGGVTIARADFVSPTHDGLQPLLDERLVAGTYRVISYQRTCGPSGCGQDPSASTLDRPSARCSKDFDVNGGESAPVLIAIDPVEGTCRITAGLQQLL